MPHPPRPGRSGARLVLSLAGAALALLASTGNARGQDPIRTPADATADTTRASVVRRPAQDTAREAVVREPRPGQAFLRSVILPGWGQAGYDAYFRGGVYYAGWAGSWFMNIKNAARLEEARELRRRRQFQVLDSLDVVALADTAIAAILTDPARADELSELIAQDSVANEMRMLVSSREQQREDWIAVTIFWTLAAGVDAFVTAHLSDFPAAVGIEPEPGGGATLRFEVPLGRRRR